MSTLLSSTDFTPPDVLLLRKALEQSPPPVSHHMLVRLKDHVAWEPSLSLQPPWVSAVARHRSGFAQAALVFQVGGEEQALSFPNCGTLAWLRACGNLLLPYAELAWGSTLLDGNNKHSQLHELVLPGCH
jgi:hypothetical protein